MPTHLLAIDLDFTLLDHDREIPVANREAIQKALDAGIAVVLASGRGAGGVGKYASQLGLEGPMVTCNGSFVVTPLGEVIKEHLLPPERLRTIIEFARAGGHHLHLYCRDEVLMPEFTEWADIYVHKAKQLPPRAVGWEGMLAATANKAIIVTAPETVLAIESSARALFPEKESVTLSEPEYLEFLCPEASKATGLAAVGALIGVPRELTAAIGDYYNDIPMLEWAGHSAAVDNAPSAVKQSAKIVVPAHDRGGVAAYIDMLIRYLGEWDGPSIVYNEGWVVSTPTIGENL
ncbi:MAG: Cof-type HAD-IIB family hydrolase [Armatimonadota bacterium]|nr:Cof-type HAD-IIB family hydrolase [Armatimonadota bacterium]